MVKRETDFPHIRNEIIEADSAHDTFSLVVRVLLKQRWLRSQEYSLTAVDEERDAIRALLQSRVDLLKSKERELGIRGTRFSTPPPHFPIPGDPQNAREWSQYEQLLSEFRVRHCQQVEEQKAETSHLEQHVRQLTASIPMLPCIARILLAPVPLSSDASSHKSYVLYKGSLWSSTKKLQTQDWQVLIDNFLSVEAAKISYASNSLHPACSREAIPAPIRVAVWRRDQGRCTRCGGREKLEFDHIIPVAMGGSNTTRNIELLCETCNRQKGASLGTASG